MSFVILVLFAVGVSFRMVTNAACTVSAAVTMAALDRAMESGSE